MPTCSPPSGEALRCASCLHRLFCIWRFPRKRRNRSCQGPPSFPCLGLNLKHTSVQVTVNSSTKNKQKRNNHIRIGNSLLETKYEVRETVYVPVAVCFSSWNQRSFCAFTWVLPAGCIDRHYSLSWLCRCCLMTCSSLRYENRIHVGLSKSCVVRCIVKCKRVSFNQWRWE